jgi:D-psicose/D-tagatose/L-ribulose 3-epimerase
MLRHAICNEVYEKWDFAQACASIRKAGYTGIEIAHFTLAPSPTDIPADARREYRRIMAGEGLAFVGLHWLMVAPKGLHVTTPDDALRAKSWQHIHDLVDLCADLSPDPSTGGSGDRLMIFGSPFQRNSTGGSTPAQATRRFVDGLKAAAPHAADRGVTILVESLPKAQSDIVNTVAEAVAIVDEIGSPAIRTMFDTHNAADETDPHAMVVDRYLDKMRHVHVNEMDGRYCGTGGYDFGAIFEVLKRRDYKGWVSLEVFDFQPGAEEIANASLRHLKSVGG